MWKSVLAISLGASIGALLRWQFGDRFNSVFPTIPPGTLAANLVGGYVIGLAIALHVIGSVTMTFAGIATIVWTRG